MVKPIMKSNKEEIEDIVNSAAERAAKKVFETSIGTEDGTEGKKFSEVLKDIKNKGKSGESKDKDKDKDGHDHSHSTDEIDCPTCKTGHVHKLKNDESGTFKCTGPDCGKEYHLLSTTPEFQCINCGTPVDKPPKELENKYFCPTCGKDHFKEFDKRKIKKIKA